jgi:mono/diheme cytochrome c family protein
MIEKIIAGILIVNLLGFIFLWNRNQNLLYAIFAVSLLVLFGFTVVKEFTAEWRGYQDTYIKMQLEKEKNHEVIEVIKSSPIRIYQIWNPELGVTDRCITCHLAVDNPTFKDAAEPFRYHSAAREHEFAKIGCTICHQGQGRATETEQAHAREKDGTPIEHWDFPMWPVNMVQSSCPKCHQQVYEKGYNLKGSEMLMQAREITYGNNDMGLECTVCHTIRGVGEVLAPDLTEFGDRTEHEFELTHVMKYVEGKKNMRAWTYQHFINPPKVTPGDPAIHMEPTIMPIFGFTPEQAHALTTYVLSFKQNKTPVKYVYNDQAAKQKSASASKVSFIMEFEKQFANFDQLPLGQQLFIRANCWFCHSVDGKGGKIGKDLTHVGKKMSKEALKELFETPSKIMRHQLGTKLSFTPEQVNAISDYLTSLK